MTVRFVKVVMSELVIRNLESVLRILEEGSSMAQR
jgi:hypothetical protein